MFKDCTMLTHKSACYTSMRPWVRGPESAYTSMVCGTHLRPQAWTGKDRWIPRALWPACLAELVYLKKHRGAEDGSAGSVLAAQTPPRACTHRLPHVHAHTDPPPHASILKVCAHCPPVLVLQASQTDGNQGVVSSGEWGGKRMRGRQGTQSWYNVVSC